MKERLREAKYPNAPDAINRKNKIFLYQASTYLVREIAHHDILGEGGPKEGSFMNMAQGDRWAEPLHFEKKAMLQVEAAAIDHMTNFFAKAAFYCKLRGAITIEIRDLKIAEGTRHWAYDTPEYNEMIERFIKKPRSDDHLENKHKSVLAGTNNGKEFMQNILSDGVHPALDPEKMPRGCTDCMLRHPDQESKCYRSKY